MAHQPILNPEVPYVGKVEGGLTSGKMVRVQGRVPPDSTFFAINYQLGPGLNPRDDVALHVSPRFNEGIIIRNHIKSMSWGEEESDGPLWLQPGAPFEIIILCEYQCYKIAVNGRHFTEFAHRLPYIKVTHLVIDGDVEITSIFYETVSTPKPSAPMPDDPVDVGPPAQGGLYPTLNVHEKKPPSDVNDSKHKQRDYNLPSNPYKADEKVNPGLDKVGLAVGGLVAAGTVAAAMHAYKKNKKKHDAEAAGDYQKVKPPKSPISASGLGTLGAALATGLAANAFQRDMKAHAYQGYPPSDARTNVFGNLLGALGGGSGRSPSNYKQQSQSNLLGEVLGGVLGGGGHRQQPHYPSTNPYGGYPPTQDSRGGSDLGNGLGGVLFKSALDGLSSHVSQKVEKKMAKELTKSLSKSLNLTPKKA